ncbi:MAG: nicotinate-nucleotide adenylyltransferase [Micrococcaceae bacterium]
MTQATKKKTRLGVMGGTFDPIHHGHLVAASEVATRYNLEEVVFVPTGQPWQKAGKEVTAAEHRYLMTVIATASNPRFTTSRVDVDRDGPTYTFDTLKDLKEQHPDTDLVFITGADAMANIMSWKNVDKMWDLAHFVGVTRPGYELPDMENTSVSYIEIPALAISSTDCRRRVEEGIPVWYLVPDGVVQYIQKYHLYGSEE